MVSKNSIETYLYILYLIRYMTKRSKDFKAAVEEFIEIYRCLVGHPSPKNLSDNELYGVILPAFQKHFKDAYNKYKKRFRMYARRSSWYRMYPNDYGELIYSNFYQVYISLKSASVHWDRYRNGEGSVLFTTNYLTSKKHEVEALQDIAMIDGMGFGRFFATIEFGLALADFKWLLERNTVMYMKGNPQWLRIKNIVKNGIVRVLNISGLKGSEMKPDLRFIRRRLEHIANKARDPKKKEFIKQIADSFR